MEIFLLNNLPDALRQIPDPPSQLYYAGNSELLQKPALAFVGTRKSTAYGEKITEKLIAELAGYDLVIVSGMALGIDSCAHKAALKYGLPTIAILGSGLSQIYPTENIRLAEEIATKGLIISEYPPDTPPRKMNFPQRNRLISALSLATIVIEAPLKSGALITAEFALEQGKDIFTVPGDIDKENSQGPIALLQKGAAYPITSAGDLIEFLADRVYEKPRGTQLQMPIAVKHSALEETVFAVIAARHRGATLLEIGQKTNLATSEILTALTNLELNGEIIHKHTHYTLKSL